MSTGRGVDVHPFYQRGARFDGVEYAWIKMADGAAVYAKKVDGVWYTADEHARRLRASQTPFGGYVYAQPGDGAAEARVLWSECQRLGGTGVAPACDIESNKDIHTWSTQEAIDHGRAFCSWYRGRGIRPAIYMNVSLAQATRPDRWPEKPVIWIARYGLKPEVLHNGVQYTGHYDVHQYADNGTLPGSAGAVDENQAYTSEHLLEGDMTPQEFLDTKVTWWDGHTVAVKDLFAEVYIAARGLQGKPAFEGQPPLQLAPLGKLLENDAREAAALAAIEAATKNPGITVEAMREIVNEAVKQNINITGELHIGPATEAPAEATQ